MMTVSMQQPWANKKETEVKEKARVNNAGSAESGVTHDGGAKYSRWS